MPGTGTYTQDEVDALIAGLQRDVDLKATRGELSVHSQQNTNQIQTNINDLTNLNTEMAEQQAITADLARKLRANHTHTVQLFRETPTTTGVFDIYFPQEPMTVSRISAYVDQGNAIVNVVKLTGDAFNGYQRFELLTSNLDSNPGDWVYAVPDQNAGFATGEHLAIEVISISASPRHLNVQVDYTVN